MNPTFIDDIISSPQVKNIVIGIILAVYYGAVYFGVIVPGLLEILISAYLLAVVIQNVYDKGETNNDSK